MGDKNRCYSVRFKKRLDCYMAFCIHIMDDIFAEDVARFIPCYSYRRLPILNLNWWISENENVAVGPCNTYCLCDSYRGPPIFNWQQSFREYQWWRRLAGLQAAIVWSLYKFPAWNCSLYCKLCNGHCTINVHLTVFGYRCNQLPLIEKLPQWLSGPSSSLS